MLALVVVIEVLSVPGSHFERIAIAGLVIIYALIMMSTAWLLHNFEVNESASSARFAALLEDADEEEVATIDDYAKEAEDEARRSLVDRGIVVLAHGAIALMALNSIATVLLE